MKRLIAVFLCATLHVVAFAEDISYKVMYDGGSVPGTKAGTGLKLYIEPNQIRFAKDNREVVVIPASAVTEISYGQDVHRRVGTAVAVGVFTLGVGALTALSKSKKHYVGLTWANGDQKGGCPRARIGCLSSSLMATAHWQSRLTAKSSSALGTTTTSTAGIPVS